METKIIIDSDSVTPEELKQLLEDEIRDVRFQLEKPAYADSSRGIEATVLTTSVTGVFGFLASMLGFAAKRQAREIPVTGRSGWQVKLPADLPPEDISRYINAAQEKEIEVVQV